MNEYDIRAVLEDSQYTLQNSVTRAQETGRFGRWKALSSFLSSTFAMTSELTRAVVTLVREVKDLNNRYKIMLSSQQERTMETNKRLGFVESSLNAGLHLDLETRMTERLKGYVSTANTRYKETLQALANAEGRVREVEKRMDGLLKIMSESSDAHSAMERRLAQRVDALEYPKDISPAQEPATVKRKPGRPRKNAGACS